jgi:ABC-type lipoprotein release transport system permease subunit
MIAIVAFGVASMVITWGFSDGVLDSMARARITLDLGDLQVHRAGYSVDPNPGLAIADDGRALAAVSAITAVTGVAPRLDAPGLLRSAYGTAPAGLRGVRPADEIRVTRVAETVVTGRFLASPGEAVLSRRLAERLDVRVGERFVFVTGSPRGPDAAAAVLVGTLDTGVPQLDETLALVHFDDLQHVTLAPGPTALVVRTRQVDAVRAAVTRRLGDGYEVLTLAEMAPLLDRLRHLAAVELVPLSALLTLLAGIGVANTMLMAVLERTREFGVLLAIGMRPRRLSALIVTEAALAALLGFVVGSLVGLCGNLAMARWGVDLSAVAEVMSAAGGPAVVYGQVRGWYWLYALTVVVATAVLAAWLPARRVAGIQPRETLQVLE